MPIIKFSPEEKNRLTTKLQDYLLQEFELEAGQFEAEFFLDFISENMGAYFYNQGLSDSQAIFNSKIVDISDAIYEIEMPTQG